MGDRVLAFFDQPMEKVIPLGAQMVLLGLLVSGIWNGKNVEKMLEALGTDVELVTVINEIVSSSKGMNELIDKVRSNQERLMRVLAE
jgi:hypothetical protein